MSLPSFSPPAALKIVCLSMAILFFSTSECRAQFPVRTEVAYNKLLFRIEVSKTTEESYTIKLVSVAKDTLGQLKSDVDMFINNWQKDVFTAAISKLVREIWPDSLKFEEWPDAGKLDTLLANSYSKLESKRFAASTESLAQLNYGLTEKEVEDLKTYKAALLNLQDTLRMFKARQKLYPGYEDSIRRLRLQGQVQDIPKISKSLASVQEPDKMVFPVTFTDDSLRIIRRFLKKQINRIDGRRKFIVSLVGNSNVVSSFKSIDRSEINAGFGVIASKPSYSEFFCNPDRSSNRR